MIPKKIHYCWFGGNPLPEKAKRCIASWRKFCPDYEIIEWNESNFDSNTNAYIKKCYDQKKYAFLTDYLRLLIIYEHGGLYFDTDVEVVRGFDELLENRAFFGFENDEYVNTGEGFGAEAGNQIVEQMIREYDQLLDGEHGIIGCPILNTESLLRFGLVRNGQFQRLNGAVVYPADYFNPYDSVTGKLKKTKHTYSIHWYSASWLPWYKRARTVLTKPLHRMQRWFH